MCGTASHKSEHGHGHPHHLFRVPTAHVAAYEYLVKENKTSDPKKPGDTLTAFSRSTFDKCSSFFGELKNSPAYKVLFFTQPAHVIMALAVILVAASMLPGDMKKASNANGESAKPRTFVNFVYLAAFCTHVGAQFWMTFISGLSLYFNLARHAFGDVQKILFPKYFSLNSLLSAITLIQFGKMHVAANVWDVHTYLQLFVLSLCFLLELMIRLYVVPPLLRLITVKTAIEKSAGVGNEVGHYDLGPLVDCPHYMAIHKAFRQVHLFVGIGNVVTMMCTAFHLAYIAA
ncbi:transmembrane protein 205 [Metopolophium dirhodum]|uniref:transmembrane protein 205 n=1 Tax=Metopolophium dirhodum TaxID=44670 RepID=UPI00298FDB0B|nr:transmembrane protein 205 [Metopolophium dirhodum]